MDARTIQTVISCRGSGRLRRDVPNAAAIWWKKAISWYVQTISAGLSRRRKKTKGTNNW